MNPASVVTFLQKLKTLIGVGQSAANYTKTTSLVDATKLARVEPLTIVSKDCISLEYLPDVLQSLLSIFSGYYLQAVALSAKIDNVKVYKVLDRLNPDRDASGYLASFSMESFKGAQTQMASAYKFRLPRSLNHALEDSAADREARLPVPDMGTSDSNIKGLTEVTNLAVGKILNVDICFNDQKKTIPISVRLASSVIPNSSILHILALKTEDNTLSERWHAYRAGRIAFWKDLVLCQDLIDTHKEALMQDNVGAYSEIVRRANNAKKYGIIDQNPSLVSASNLFVISEAVAKELEAKLGGKLSNPRVRNMAFENTYAMIICVVDREYERVTFYHRGIAAATDVSIKDIRMSNKNKGPDIMDILKSYQMGVPASF